MATESRGSEPGRDLAGIILAVIFILVAVAALWDTTNMADSDSYVFPRAVAIAMIVFSLDGTALPQQRSRPRGASDWWPRCWSARRPCLTSAS